MSPMGIWRIMLTRLMSITLINFIFITILLYVSMVTTDQWLNIDVITILPVLILSMISMFGLGFMIAGISIILKQVQSFLQILQFILAGLAFIPLSNSLLLSYFPFVKGIDIIRSIMINGLTFSQIATTDIIILFVNGVVYFILGLIVFLYCERVAVRKGLLAHY